jgi:endoglucanase
MFIRNPDKPMPESTRAVQRVQSLYLLHLQRRIMKYLAAHLLFTLNCGLAAVLFAPAVHAQAASDVQSCTDAQPASGNGQVLVVDKRLTRDGTPWIPHGFYQVPFEVPPAAFATQLAFWQKAYDGFTPSEYTEMKAQGADSVRFQIAQDGADPENQEFYDPAWFRQAIGAICAARAAGLTVIVSVQDEKQTGVKKQAPLPDDATRRVWQQLAPLFRHDRGVLYELYNEPNDLPQPEASNPDTDLRPTAEQWQRWAEAMNATIKTVRDTGAENVIVADGLVHAQQLAGAPELDDPRHQVIYAAHPYVSGSTQEIADYNQTRKAWDEKFGNFARNEPVIISEWGIGYFCDAKTPQAVVNFLNYLNERGIGLEAGIWDFAAPGFNNLTHGFPNVTFTSFHNASGSVCNLNNAPAGYGPGKTVESWYMTGTPPTTPQ